MEVWFSFLGWFLSIVTALGNSFVIFLIGNTQRLYTSSNWFVLSLAVADLCVGVFVFPLGFLCSVLFCNMRLYAAFHWFFLHSSVANLCVLTWDRFTAIVYPFRYHTSTSARRPLLLIMSAWLTCLVISLALFFGMYVIETDTAHKVLRLIGVSGFDVICCVYLFYAVVRILVVARRHSKHDQHLQQQVLFNQNLSTDSQFGSTRVKCSRRGSAAAFIAVIILFFLSCYTLINYLILCHAFLPCHGAEAQYAPKATTVLVVLNSAVNPVVYALLKKDIKTELQRIVRRNKFDSRSENCGSRQQDTVAMELAH